MAAPDVMPPLPDDWVSKIYLAPKDTSKWFELPKTEFEIKRGIDRNIEKLRSLGEGGRKLIRRQRMLQAGLLDDRGTVFFGKQPRMLFEQKARQVGKTVEMMTYNAIYRDK